MLDIENEKHTLFIQVYTELLPKIRKVAKKHGYAIAVHGSLTRDFDLIAFPWSDRVVKPDILVKKIMSELGLIKNFMETLGRKEVKPKGRVAYDIQLGFGAYIDISVYTQREA